MRGHARRLSESNSGSVSAQIVAIVPSRPAWALTIFIARLARESLDGSVLSGERRGAHENPPPPIAR